MHDPLANSCGSRSSWPSCSFGPVSHLRCAWRSCRTRCHFAKQDRPMGLRSEAPLTIAEDEALAWAAGEGQQAGMCKDILAQDLSWFGCFGVHVWVAALCVLSLQGSRLVCTCCDSAALASMALTISKAELSDF